MGFAPHEDSAQPKVLIECAACKTAAQSTVSSIEYEVLLATGLISRHCDRCNETTRWKPSDQVVTPEILVRSNKSASKGAQKVRRTRRLKLTMQLRVRNSWGVVDIAQTRDVSKVGSLLCQQPALFTWGRNLYHPALCEESGPGGDQGKSRVDGGRHRRPVLRGRVSSLRGMMAGGMTPCPRIPRLPCRSTNASPYCSPRKEGSELYPRHHAAPPGVSGSRFSNRWWGRGESNFGARQLGAAVRNRHGFAPPRGRGFSGVASFAVDECSNHDKLACEA